MTTRTTNSTNSTQLDRVTVQLGQSSSNTAVQYRTLHESPLSPNITLNIEMNNLDSQNTNNASREVTVNVEISESHQPPPVHNLATKFSQWAERNSDRLLLTAMVAYQASATVAGGLAGRHYLPFEDKSVRMTAGALGAYAAAPLASSFAAWATGHPRAATVLGLAPLAPITVAASFALSKISHGGEQLVRWVRDNKDGLILTGVCMYQLSAAIGGAVAGNHYLQFEDPEVRMGVGAVAGYVVAPFASSLTAWMLGHPETAAGLLGAPFIGPCMAFGRSWSRFKANPNP